MQYFIIILALVALDQLTKYVILTTMALGQSIPLVGILKLTYIQNTGAAFSLFHNASWFFTVVSVITVILIVLALIFWNKPILRNYHLALSIVIGGAVGNLIDRVFRGFVVDFIDFTYFPVFNIADIAVCVGVALLALQIFREGDSDSPKEAAKNHHKV
ncbi:MAG: signal peptidase II [Bacillota bacterium]|nr:signal peptidase II [Bacillota bacterium]